MSNFLICILTIDFVRNVILFSHFYLTALSSNLIIAFFIPDGDILYHQQTHRCKKQELLNNDKYLVEIALMLVILVITI